MAKPVLKGLGRFLGLLLVLLLSLTHGSHAWLYLTNATTNETTLHRSFDYEGDIADPYDIIGVVVPIPIGSDCEVNVPAHEWDPSQLDQPLVNGTDPNTINSTLLLITRWPPQGIECINYGPIMQEMPNIIRTLETEQGYPPVRVLLFTAMADEATNYGSINSEYYRTYYDDKPANVSVAYLGNDFGTRLHAEVMNATAPIVVQVIQDMGIWNEFRQSAVQVVMTVLNYLLNVPVLAFAVYYTARWIYRYRIWRDRRLLILLAIVFYLIGSMLTPLGTMYGPGKIITRYVCWTMGFGSYAWVLLSWSNIIRKIQRPRFWWFLIGLVYIEFAFFIVHAILNCAYSVRPTHGTANASILLNTMILPPVLVLKGIVFCIYGILFLRFIRGHTGYEKLRPTFRKLTHLTYATLLGFIFFAVCSSLSNTYFDTIIWITPFRNIGCSITSSSLSAIIMVVLRVHEAQPHAVNPPSMPSQDRGTSAGVSRTLVTTSSHGDDYDKPMSPLPTEKEFSYEKPTTATFQPLPHDNQPSGEAYRMEPMPSPTSSLTQPHPHNGSLRPYTRPADRTASLRPLSTQDPVVPDAGNVWSHSPLGSPVDVEKPSSVPKYL
ncbi:hypothetical protein H4R35_004393 [Dimargaris xerosporica]|nr:hypothetical protein H4R35_004393 [Dimargaris xerosporica]